MIKKKKGEKMRSGFMVLPRELPSWGTFELTYNGHLCQGVHRVDPTF